MWCPRCHTEVAAEIAQSGQSLNCTSCGTEIQRIYAPSLHPDTRSARELLERWSKADVLDVASEPLTEIPSQPALTIIAAETPAVPVAMAAADESPIVTAIPAPITSEQVSVSATDSEAAGASEESSHEAVTGRRDRPERARPERQTPRPRTTWRADSAHSVTQPAAPLPPPVPPRRPHFSALAGDNAVTTPAMKQPEQKPLPIGPSPAAVARALETIQKDITESIRAVAPERVDSPRVEKPIQAKADRSEREASRPATTRPPAPVPAVQRRLDPAHEALGGPHFDLQAFLAQDARKPGRSESIWGQVLAYAGVGLITVGTTLVIWASFGKSPQYAPTGWLICTVGQMLLFLGVTTLISGGMQQTSHEVTRRVEYLGDRLLRFEHSAEQVLRGPHFNEVRERAKAEAGVSQADADDRDV